LRLLLDTHAFVWAASGDRRLSHRVISALGDPHNQVYVSCIVGWEIAYKESKGYRLITEPFEELVERSAYTGLGLSFASGRTAFELPFHHRDPWDRMLIAQAQEENLTLVTCDAIMQRYPVSTFW
jgi:PIN domain nuclease of toxin-antitoxin system